MAVALVFAASAGLTAHERKTVGPVQLTIGWGEEPAFSGLRNFVEVDVADAAGKPIAGRAGTMSVDVVFGSEHVTLALVPGGSRPGQLRAWLVPTRPGVYTFHITGTIAEQSIDTSSTCSSQTFACVADVADVHFPVRDPSNGELADRISRALPRAERAADAALRASRLAIAAIAGSLVAVAIAAIGLFRRKNARNA